MTEETEPAPVASLKSLASYLDEAPKAIDALEAWCNEMREVLTQAQVVLEKGSAIVPLLMPLEKK